MNAVTGTQERVILEVRVERLMEKQQR